MGNRNGVMGFVGASGRIDDSFVSVELDQQYWKRLQKVEALGMKVDIFKEFKDFFSIKDGDDKMRSVFEELSLEITKFIAAKKTGADVMMGFGDFSLAHVTPVIKVLQEQKMFAKAADLVSMVRGFIIKYSRLVDL